MCAVTCLRKTKSDSVNAIRGQEHADCEAMLPLSSKHQIAKQSVTVGPSKSSVQAGDLLCAKALRPVDYASCQGPPDARAVVCGVWMGEEGELLSISFLLHKKELP